MVGRGGGVEPSSKPTPGFAALPTSVVSSKLLQYVLFGTRTEDHPSVEANAKGSPQPQPKSCPSWSQACPVVSAVLGSLPGEFQASRTKNLVTHTSAGVPGPGEDPDGAPVG